MNDFPLNLRPPSKLSDRRLALNLVLRENARIEVRSCDVTGSHFRNRTTFSDNCLLQDVIVANVAAEIQSAINRLPSGTQVMSLPDFMVELPGLVLSGAHILVTDIRNGVRNAIFRFKEFLGGINLAFHPDVGFLDSAANQGERLAANILSDICLPLLNLCRYGEFQAACPSGYGFKGMAEKAGEFEFQTELLKRYIFQSSAGQMSAVGVGLSLKHDGMIPRLAGI